MTRVAVLDALVVALAVAPAAAQSPLTAGITVGAVKLTDQRSEQALTGVLQYQPSPWLLLAGSPSFVHVSDEASGASVSSSGPGDLPVSAAAFHAFASPGTPVVAAALTVVMAVVSIRSG